MIDPLHGITRVRRQYRRPRTRQPLLAERTLTPRAIPALTLRLVRANRSLGPRHRRLDLPTLHPRFVRGTLTAEIVHRLQRRLAPVRDAARLIVALESEHRMECERAAKPLRLHRDDLQIERNESARLRTSVRVPDRAKRALTRGVRVNLVVVTHLLRSALRFEPALRRELRGRRRQNGT